MKDIEEFFKRRYKKHCRWLIMLLLGAGVSIWLTGQLWLERHWAFYFFLSVDVFYFTQIERVVRKMKDMNGGKFW